LRYWNKHGASLSCPYMQTNSHWDRLSKILQEIPWELCLTARSKRLQEKPLVRSTFLTTRQFWVYTIAKKVFVKFIKTWAPCCHALTMMIKLTRSKILICFHLFLESYDIKIKFYDHRDFHFHAIAKRVIVQFSKTWTPHYSAIVWQSNWNKLEY
jgi:hypothetical protein